MGAIPGPLLGAVTARLINCNLIEGIPLRDLSMVAWAVGTLRCGGAELCDALAREAEGRLLRVADEGGCLFVFHLGGGVMVGAVRCTALQIRQVAWPLLISFPWLNTPTNQPTNPARPRPVPRPGQQL
jgi:hypothetical protein